MERNGGRNVWERATRNGKEKRDEMVCCLGKSYEVRMEGSICLEKSHEV